VKYAEPQSISQQDVTSALASLDPDVIADALTRMSLWESDWEWAERICIIALKSNEAKVKIAALSAISNIARRFHILHLDVVLPAISKLRDEVNFMGIADDALDDIAIFVTSGNHRA
jgi:hypothetical protein